jgi:hypothetical protein
MNLGKQIIARGWRQGSILAVPKDTPVAWLVPVKGGAFEVTTSPLGDEFAVIVSQDCDIAREPELEPFVEAMAARWTDDKGELHRASTNATRRFLLGYRDLNGVQEGLIVDATRKLQIAKKVLLERFPLNDAPTISASRAERFPRWLAARYNRPAIPDPVVRAVQKPVVDAISRLGATDGKRSILDRITEIRFVADGEVPPFDVELLLICYEDEDQPPNWDEDLATIGGWLCHVIGEAGAVATISWTSWTPRTISLETYLSSKPLPLDHFTLIWEGDVGKAGLAGQ